MTTVTIKSPADIANVASRLLGFEPDDSMVVLTLGGGPSARVDLVSVPELADAFSTALRHWSRVLVALYTDDVDNAQNLARAMGTILPGVTVHDVVRIHDGFAYSALDPRAPGVPCHNGQTGTELDAKRVAPSREVLRSEAEEIGDADTAERLAVASYEAGNGARAWVFLDRADELRGHDTAITRGLAYSLTNAIEPPRNP